ncbi:MAG: class I SAM-dependent methyltransferase [Phycisphaerales bacterium]|nr:MAG: class I SAM-dependent methyltransferase [Phycisphaerales bacterium]
MTDRTAERREEDWSPLEPDVHERQIEALGAFVRANSVRTAVDLGSGDGRVGVPMAALGVRVLAIDNDDEALRRCAAAGLTTRNADLLDPALDCTLDGEPPDCAWCLGNTLMEIPDGADAAAMLRRLRAALRPGACLIIDNFSARYWPCVAQGLWVSGVSPDGTEQIVWADDDNVFALRRGDEVDVDHEEIRPGDRLIRLWTRNELRLLAMATGWEGPEEDESGELLILRRPEA